MFFLGYFSFFFPFLLLIGIILIFAFEAKSGVMEYKDLCLAENNVIVQNIDVLTKKDDCFRFEKFSVVWAEKITIPFYHYFFGIKHPKPIVIPYFSSSLYSSDYHVKFFGLSPPQMVD